MQSGTDDSRINQERFGFLINPPPRPLRQHPPPPMRQHPGGGGVEGCHASRKVFLRKGPEYPEPPIRTAIVASGGGIRTVRVVTSTFVALVGWGGV